MLAALRVPIPFTELVKRTITEIMEDNVLGLAAQLSFYFVLAMFPALIFMVALVSYLPYDVIGEAIAAMSRFAPPEVVTIVREQLRSIAASKDGGLLTLGVLFALWSSSSAVVAIIDALNRAYDIEEGRPWWKVRLIAILLTLGLAAFIISAFTLILLGPTLGRLISQWIPFMPDAERWWPFVQWPLTFILVCMGMAIVYYFAPDAEQDWVWITPGSVVASVLWILISLGFRVYVDKFGEFNATYGTLAGAMVLLLWLYLTGLCILIGGEINAEIEHASPLGKDPGEKRPGEKRRLRAFARRHMPHRPSAAPGH